MWLLKNPTVHCFDRERDGAVVRMQKEQWNGSWAASRPSHNPTWGSCSVADASPTSFSRSGTPFPPGLWGCIVLPTSRFPELPSAAPQPSRGALLPHSERKETPNHTLGLSKTVSVTVRSPSWIWPFCCNYTDWPNGGSVGDDATELVAFQVGLGGEKITPFHSLNYLKQSSTDWGGHCH